MKTLMVIRDPEAFQLLADDTRRRIIHMLRAKEMTVSQLASDLNLTPQAIYHHIRKMRDSGLVEVSREERVDHFIETYFRAAAEVFHLEHGKGDDKKFVMEQTRDAVKALSKLGLDLKAEDSLVQDIIDIQKRMEGFCDKCDWADKIEQLDDVDFFVKQVLFEYANLLSMTDEQFDEYLKLNRDLRKALRSRLAGPVKPKKKG